MAYAEKKEMTIYAQPGEDGTFLYRAKGQKTVLIDRKDPKTKEIQIGSRVRGSVSFEDEKKIILRPSEVSPPVQMEVKAVPGEGGTVIGYTEEGKAVLFYTDSPVTPNIRPEDIVQGVIIRDEPTFLWLYPMERSPGRKEEIARGALETPPIHAFVPLILNELVLVSRGVVRSQALGLKTAVQALEDLVAASFDFLRVGDITQLGYRVGGPVPDGDVFCPSRDRAKYLLLYDTKVRSGEPGYQLTLDDKRAFEDYLRDPKYHMVSKRAFLVISNRFAEEPLQISDGTLTFIPAQVLALICAWKAMNQTLVSEESLEPLFFAGKILTEEDIRVWSRRLRLREIPI